MRKHVIKPSIKRICIFGDSIAFGNNDAVFGGWQNHLKVHFAQAGQFQHVFNLAISGRDSKDILKRMENEVKARISTSAGKEGMLIMIAVPINDTRFIWDGDERLFAVPFDLFVENMKKLILLSRSLAGKTVFVGMTRVIEEKTNPWSVVDNGVSWQNNIIEKYNDFIKDFCAKESVPFVEMFNLLDDDDLPDGLHPSAQGHEKMFKHIKEFLGENEIIAL